ncbi:unnamed protein product [Durusdinium trenchii]|uniref:RING-type domain-containing protein n=1 Tax=Durusdinium trenchii TaxID=1381693 RepID=A0ABP0HCR9_9DINO
MAWLSRLPKRHTVAGFDLDDEPTPTACEANEEKAWEDRNHDSRPRRRLRNMVEEKENVWHGDHGDQPERSGPSKRVRSEAHVAEESITFATERSLPSEPSRCLKSFISEDHNDLFWDGDHATAQPSAERPRRRLRRAPDVAEEPCNEAARPSSPVLVPEDPFLDLSEPALVPASARSRRLTPAPRASRTARPVEAIEVPDSQPCPDDWPEVIVEAVRPRRRQSMSSDLEIARMLQLEEAAALSQSLGGTLPRRLLHPPARRSPMDQVFSAAMAHGGALAEAVAQAADRRFRPLLQETLGRREPAGTLQQQVQSLSAHRDFTADDYDLLLQLDGETSSPQGEEELCYLRSMVDLLPLSVVRAGAVAQCMVCLDSMEVGQEVRTLPCMHTFHRGCIDRWLCEPGRRPRCPIDQGGSMNLLPTDAELAEVQLG